MKRGTDKKRKSKEEEELRIHDLRMKRGGREREKNEWQQEEGKDSNIGRAKGALREDVHP